MAKRKQTGRHRLLIYHRLGQRWRVPPLLTALLGGALYVFSSFRPLPLLVGRRGLLIVLAVASLLIYILALFISRASHVEARPSVLRVRAGLVPLKISYGRIVSIRLTRPAHQYPPSTLRPGERALVEPFLGQPATAVDLRSFPMNVGTLRRLWSKFMFLTDHPGLMFVVDDAMLLNQQIDDCRQRRLDQKAGRVQRSMDPFERLSSQQRRR
jgi:hypothetical protein